MMMIMISWKYHGILPKVSLFGIYFSSGWEFLYFLKFKSLSAPKCILVSALSRKMIGRKYCYNGLKTGFPDPHLSKVYVYSINMMFVLTQTLQHA